MSGQSVEIRQALEASDRAYGLLIWLGGLVNSGSITVDDARNALSSTEETMRFLKSHRDGLPVELVPPDGESERLTGNVLGSHLRVSFELDDEPEVRRSTLHNHSDESRLAGIGSITADIGCVPWYPTRRLLERRRRVCVSTLLSLLIGR